jgi:hypothetical protein
MPDDPGDEKPRLVPKRMISPRLLELETAKEILKEIFHARSSDVEDMIQRRLERRRAGARITGLKRRNGHKSSAWASKLWAEASRALGWVSKRSRPGG